MQTLWYILVAFMLAMYVLLDGFDLGAGVIHLAAGKTERERRAILRAIGPVWDGNEVWLIASGGTLFFAFPLLYAAGFSGFYLPLFIVLWLLMLRGVAIELRAHLRNPVWAAFWDGTFFLGSAGLALFYGVALANVVRGVPLDRSGYFFLPLWTDFNPRSALPGILDWYTLLIGLLALAVLTVHGATYIAVKTEGELNARAQRIARRWWVIAAVLTLPSTLATFWVRPDLLASFGTRPWAVVFPMLAVGGLAGIGYQLYRGRERGAFLASGAYIAGLLSSTVAVLYPNVLTAVIRANSLTVHNASGSHYGLVVGLAWWSIGMVLAVLYLISAYRLFRGKVRLDDAEGYA